MNEQNNNLNPGVQPTPQPSVQPQAPVAAQPVQVDAVAPQASAPVQETVQAVQPEVAPTPVAPEVTVQPVEPVQAVAPAPVQAGPVDAVAPQTSAPVQETVQPEVAPTPVVEPVVQPQVVEQPVAPEVVGQPNMPEAPVQEAVAPTMSAENVVQQPQVTPAPVEQVDIVQQAPLNPLGNDVNQNNFVNPSIDTAPPINPITPMTPMGGAVDATGVGFVAGGEPVKKKSKLPIIIAIIVVLVAAIAAGVFFFLKSMASDPKTIYEATIKAAFKEVNTTVNDYVHDKAILNIQGSYDTNIEDIKAFAGYTYGLNVGIDPKNKLFQGGFSVKDSSDVGYSADIYLKDNKQYLRYSTYRDLIYAGEMDATESNDFFASFEEIFKATENASSEDINYVVNKISDLVVESIDESKLTKEDASIEVNGETLKVTNNKYEINKETAENMTKHVIDGLKNDAKTIEILAKLTASTEEEVKEGLVFEEDTEDEDNENADRIIYTSIYTTGFKSEVVGFALTTNKDDLDMHYYNRENYFEFTYKAVEENIDTGKEEENTAKVIGNTKNGITTVDVTVNDKKVLTLNVKNWTDTLKEFDYVVESEEMNVKGSVKLEVTKSDSKIKTTLDFSVKVEEEYINVSLELSEDWGADVANINTGTAVTLDETNLQLKTQEFLSGLMTTPIGTLIQSMMYSNQSNDYQYDVDDPLADEDYQDEDYSDEDIFGV